MQKILSCLEDYDLDLVNDTIDFYIQGGYYETIHGVDTFSLNSLQLAANLASYLKQINPEHSVSLGVLVNDLGQSCSGEICSLPLTSNGTVEDIEKLSNSYLHYSAYLMNLCAV